MKSLIIVALAILISACSQIDTGNVGVEKTLGQVKPEIMPPGVYFTLFKSVTEVCAKELPLQLNDLRPQTNDKITLHSARPKQSLHRDDKVAGGYFRN